MRSLHSLRSTRRSLSLSRIHRMPPTVTLGKARVERVESLESKDAKFISLSKLHWKDEHGKARLWECAERKTRGASGVDAVAILALIAAPDKPLSTVLVLQYRPPVNAVVVELPAGLVDGDEDPAACAVRELYEETGYGSKGVGQATVKDVSPLLVNDPGMSSASMKLVTVQVDLSAEEAAHEPEPCLEADEHIEKRLVAVNELQETLEELDAAGYKIDARLYHYAHALRMAQRV